MKKDKRGIIHGIDIIGDAIAEAEKNSAETAVAETAVAETAAAETAAAETAAAEATAAETTAAETAAAETTAAEATAAETTAAEATAAETTAAETTAAATAPGLSNDYLVGGYYKGKDKGRYLDPDLVDQAEKIGKALAVGGVTPTAFNRMVKTLKSAAKLPYEAQEGALKKLMPQVLEQERKKKAPALLREVVERNREAVHSQADFAACLDHFRDIGIYLAAQAVAEGTPKE